jgi:colanic acid biosynthesis glycosyl transferase WcaI
VEHYAGSDSGDDVEVVTARRCPSWQVAPPHRNTYSVERDDGTMLMRRPLLLRRGVRGMWRLIGPRIFTLSCAPVVILHGVTRKPAVVPLADALVRATGS